MSRRHLRSDLLFVAPVHVCAGVTLFYMSYCGCVAQVAELVDAYASGAYGSNPVEVQVLFWAPVVCRLFAVCAVSTVGIFYPIFIKYILIFLTICLILCVCFQVYVQDLINMLF